MTARPRCPAAFLFVLGIAACAPSPPRVTPLPAPTPVPSPAPSATPTPAPPPVFPEVKPVSLDVAIGIDRPSAGVPAGDWILLAEGKAEARRGPLVFRPSTPPGAVVVEENGKSEERPSPVGLARADGSPVPFGDASYRGVLFVRATFLGTLHVVNRVNVEDYLKGVVPAEMGPRVYDEVEALKAQAIAARTYALRHLGDSAAEGYDLCATPRCQVYGGTAVEHPLSSRAIEETAGLALTFEGALADTLFTSTCGGRTESASEVFPNGSPPRPYLVSVVCAGETPWTLPGRPVAKGTLRPATLLGTRGRAFLAALGKDPTPSGLVAARNTVRARVGLPPRSGAHALWPASAYAEIVEAAGFGNADLLTEEIERAGAPVGWSPKARAAWAVLSRFQISGSNSLPVSRALHPEEVAGLWAGILGRLGDFEEIEGRLVGVAPSEITVKSAKGKSTYTLSTPALLAGAADAAIPVGALRIYPGDRVRVFARDGRVVGLLRLPAPADGTSDRDSAWIHWTRRFTGAELAAKLKERDPSRPATIVRKVEVLERSPSGRARKVRVTADAGPTLLAGLEIRFALGLPETLFTVVSGKEAGGGPVFTFYGRGWGHGVGLCQNGAFGMALAGRSAEEILSRYYPGTAIVPMASLSFPSGGSEVR
ncbi:MAG: SpoIID/LytB domain-containing protein [Thermoanaerobaculia bacterium]